MLTPRSWTVLASLLLLTACTQPSPSASPTPASATPSSAQVSTPPNAPTPATTDATGSLRLTTAGDYRDTDNTVKVLAGVTAVKPLANVMLGDLSYGKAGEEAQWCDFVRHHNGDLPQIVISGNHESDGRNGWIGEFVNCLEPPPGTPTGDYGKEFTLDLPSSKPLVRLVMISPGMDFADGEGDWSYAPGTRRYEWTAQAIDDARAQGIPWVVVGLHRPCISVGTYTCKPGAALMNLLLTKNVDLVLSGHEHLYQRSKQLVNGVSGCRELPINKTDTDCISGSGSTFTAGEGTIFATVGTGGTPLRRSFPKDPEMGYFDTLSATNADPSYGFLQLDLTATSLSASFDNVDTGSFTDDFKITKP